MLFFVRNALEPIGYYTYQYASRLTIRICGVHSSTLARESRPQEYSFHSTLRSRTGHPTGTVASQGDGHENTIGREGCRLLVDPIIPLQLHRNGALRPALCLK